MDEELIECQLCQDYHKESEMQKIGLDGRILVVGKKCFSSCMEKAAAFDITHLNYLKYKRKYENLRRVLQQNL